MVREAVNHLSTYFQSMQISDQGQFCSACGKPPRVAANGSHLVALKRCSRCRQAWYHDMSCQKQHYRKHKVECSRWAQHITAYAPQSSMPVNQSGKYALKVKVEVRPNRGNSLVASELIRKSERISPGINDADFWNPLVPPVLLESQRRSRCSFCFGRLDTEQFRYGGSRIKSERKIYPLLFCSTGCREEGRKFGFDIEEELVERILERRGPVRIFPTAVLLYRILQSAKIHPEKEIEEQFSRLQDIGPKSSDDASYHHSQAVIAIVLSMLQCSGDLCLFLPSKEVMEIMVNRIKINGFSIADGENVAMGIGIFITPSFVNHSCQPNAIQTFLYGQKGHPPSLFLTAHADIPSGHEVQISYIDNSCPRHIRRHRLECDYFFRCDCDACNDTELESYIMGMRCPHCHDCKYPVKLLQNLAPAPQAFQCSQCLASDFSSPLRILQSFEDIAGSKENPDMSTSERLHKNLQQICIPESWYVQESGDKLAHVLLDKLGEAKTVQEQEKFASLTLQVLHTLMDADATRFTTSRQFRRLIQCIQAARLSLFLDPNPSSALQLLHEAQQQLSLYYPGNHELLLNISVAFTEARM